MPREPVDPSAKAAISILRSLSLSARLLEVISLRSEAIENDHLAIEEARAAFRQCLSALERVPNIPGSILKEIEDEMQRLRELMAELRS